MTKKKKKTSMIESIKNTLVDSLTEEIAFWKIILIAFIVEFFENFVDWIYGF